MPDVLNSRASLELAAFFVTWATVALLVLLVIGLHARLRRLEQRSRQAASHTPYGHLLGTRLADVVGVADAERQPRVLLFVSSGCQSCQRLIEQVTSPAWTVPSAVLWTDRAASVPAGRGPVTVLADGPRISAELGIRVTPFALVADEMGQIVKAGPVSSLQSLGEFNGSARDRTSRNAAKSRSARGDGQP